MAEIRFLHIADLHLDSPFKGLTSIPESRMKDIRESTFYAFTKVIEYALESKPDFVLIVGDIYDGENRSLRAQHLFQNGMEALNKADIPVFISYGNHDHLSGSWVRFELPGNVHVMGGEVETKSFDLNGMRVHISGFSYKERHIREEMHGFYPIANGHDVHIGMLHGSMEGNTEHDVYAPFRKKDLLEKGYDYWALGHIHKRQFVHHDPPIVYPGNTQSRHRNEKGIKGFYEVTLTKEKADLQFIPSSTFIYDEIEIACDGIVHANELILHIEDFLQNYSQTNGNAIVELTLTEISEETSELLQASTTEEWLSLIQESIDTKDFFIIVKGLSIEFPKEKWQESTNMLEILNEWDIFDWKYALKDLYQHPKGSKYLPTIDQAFIDEMIKEAEHALSKVVARGSNH